MSDLVSNKPELFTEQFAIDISFSMFIQGWAVGQKKTSASNS